MKSVDHLVLGAGFAGLCAAIKLDEAGERDFLVIEKGSEVGGTWRDNTYPGAACDVPSQLYSFSFAPNPDWSMSFSPQPEIQAYLRRTAAGSGTLDRFVFDTAMTDASWDDQAQRWIVTTTGETYSARTLIAGTGGLSEPKLPDIEDIADFAGEIFHSARWNHDADLTGKRVAVIGTGASAIQIVPQVQAIASHLDVYQRTAPYVLPRHDRTYGDLERRALKGVPGLQKAYRTAIFWGRETYVPAFTWQPRIAWPAKQMALANLRKGVPDPALRARLTPDFELGCKRVLISNTYYPALAAPTTEVVTDPIARVTPTGIVTSDGTERPIDVLVVATGFHTTELPVTEHIRGRGGRVLADRFREGGMAAYKGTTVPGFPNLFFIVGPNTGLGHSSMVQIIESQVRYITSALKVIRSHRYGAVEPTEAATTAFNQGLQQRMAHSVWSTGGCSSWYLDRHGRNTITWPKSIPTFRRQLSRFDPAAYTVQAPVAPTGSTHPGRQDVNA